jgi:twitching motility protein PilT
MDIIEMIRTALGKHATDLQLVVDSVPLARVNGSVQPLKDQAVLTNEEVYAAFSALSSDKEREEFEREWELDFGFTIPGECRLRCNVARQINGMTLSIRIMSLRIPTIDELELPSIYKDFIREPRGLVLISGPSDSGKSTTLAAMIQYLNEREGHNIVTIEDPVEYVYKSNKSAITQRQLGTHTHSFAMALKHLLRQNPDVVMVGEMRDSETVAGVIAAAETGHLILSTGHAPSAPQAIERIVDMLPHVERELAQARLASVLVAVACQTLVPRADGSGRIAAVEIMLASTAVRHLIREGKIFQLASAMRTQHDSGTVSLDESLMDLYRRDIISFETVLNYCRDREEVGKVPSMAKTNHNGHKEKDYLAFAN